MHVFRLFAGAECNTVGGAACRRPWTAGAARDELAATLGATAGGGGDWQVLKMKEMEEPPARAWSARARAQVLSFKVHFTGTSHLAH